MNLASPGFFYEPKNTLSCLSPLELDFCHLQPKVSTQKPRFRVWDVSFIRPIRVVHSQRQAHIQAAPSPGHSGPAHVTQAALSQSLRCPWAPTGTPWPIQSPKIKFTVNSGNSTRLLFPTHSPPRLSLHACSTNFLSEPGTVQTAAVNPGLPISPG